MKDENRKRSYEMNTDSALNKTVTQWCLSLNRDLGKTSEMFQHQGYVLE